MDQCTGHVPNWGDNEDCPTMGIKIEGTICHGRSPARRVFLSFNQPGNTNTVLDTILLTIADIFEGDFSKVPPIFFLQLDNTSSTNKNNIQIAFNAALVELGIFKEVWLSFLPVGHTHEDIDQMFSCIAHAFGARPPRSLREMMIIIAGIGSDSPCGVKDTDYGKAKPLGRIKPILLKQVVDYKVQHIHDIQDYPGYSKLHLHIIQAY